MAISPARWVARRGGGDRVALESKIAEALNILGVSTLTDHGVVTERTSYIRAIIKPDILLPALHIAVELDNAPPNGRRPNNHDTPGGVEDDQLRDRLLVGLGWQVLRIRRPGQFTDRDWPWRIETTSQAPKKLAGLILAELEGAGFVPVVPNSGSNDRPPSRRSATAEPS